jgi:cell fate regulator YaaT (PSP1 superfamily)
MTPEILEISFKGNKRIHFFNPKEIKVKPGDYVIVEAEKGVDLGQVTKVGRLVAVSQIKGQPRNLIRRAVHEDLEQIRENRNLESCAFIVARDKIKRHALSMKLVDVEYQYDQNKLTFYFTSDRRVDFRELVKDLAARYHTRIELRQISFRDETRRLGGLGICGEPFCCSIFAGDSGPVTSQCVKEQHLPLNIGKLSGTCGRLKCCLVYEQQFYNVSLRNFPPLESAIITDHGQAFVDRIDIFKEQVYLRFGDEDIEVYALSAIKEFQKKINLPAEA